MSATTIPVSFQAYQFDHDDIRFQPIADAPISERVYFFF